MAETGVKDKPARNLAGEASSTSLMPNRGGRGQRDRYCAKMQDFITAGQVTDAAVGAQRAELRERIYGLSDVTLGALEDAAAGPEPRKNDVVIAVARQFGVAVGVLLKEM